jgi:predicted metal-dependent HD superfamily phosphohydrolase
VARLVELTAGHEPAADDVTGCALADADLAILGAPADRYERYRADVRAEYEHVPDDAWRTGRADVLRRFLDRPRLFHDDVLHRELDAQARANLNSELRSLGARLAPP